MNERLSDQQFDYLKLYQPIMIVICKIKQIWLLSLKQLCDLLCAKMIHMRSAMYQISEIMIYCQNTKE